MISTKASREIVAATARRIQEEKGVDHKWYHLSNKMYDDDDVLDVSKDFRKLVKKLGKRLR